MEIAQTPCTKEENRKPDVTCPTSTKIRKAKSTQMAGEKGENEPMSL